MPKKKVPATKKTKRSRSKKQEPSVVIDFIKQNAPVLLMVIGAFLVLFSIGKEISYRSTMRLNAQVSEQYQARLQERVLSSIPIQLEFPSIEHSIEVTQTSVATGQWQIPAQTVGHVRESAYPRFPGNSIFYGHNSSKILGKLDQVEVNDRVRVQLMDGTFREYQIIEKVVVEPDQVEFLEPTDFEVITIYTCTGWLDSKRLIVRAEPV